MKVLLCPDKFKGSISAENVCKALKEGLQSVKPDIQISEHPMADGGDGSIDILRNYLELRSIEVSTFDPLDRMIQATYYHSGDTAFIEMAAVSGLVLLKEEERNPMHTSTRGMGLMMKDAMDKGMHRIVLFIGGSATNDAGIGIAHAFGFEFLDKHGRVLEPVGKNLRHIHSIKDDRTIEFRHLEIEIMCDVNNTMYGPQGAAYNYAAQKGASKTEVELLDNGLRNYATVLESYSGKEISNIAGTGAAGAIGASLLGLLGGSLKNGFQILSEWTGLEEKIKSADLVITGEGKFDRTSLQGKVVGNVAKLCTEYQVSYGVVAGIIDELSLDHCLFQKSVLERAENTSDAMLATAHYLFKIGEEIAKEQFL